MMLTRTYKTWLLISSGIFITPNALAGFATYADNWPDSAEVVDERIIEKKSPIKTKTATNPAGDCPLAITFDGQKEICEDKRLYIKLGANYLNSKLNRIDNESSSSPFYGLSVSQQNMNDSYYSWEVGVGTRYDCFRIELEYVYTKTIQYDPSPVFQGASEGLISTVRNDSVMLNLFWDFNTFAYFKPYIGVLGGIAWNRTSSALVGGTLGDDVNNNSYYLSPFVYGATVGGRIPFWVRWRGYVQYRWTNQGQVTWKASNGVELKGYYLLNGLSMGIAYIF